jgi:hypothetical protein
LITAHIRFGDTSAEGKPCHIQVGGDGRIVQILIHPSEQGRDEPMTVNLEKTGVMKLISDLAQSLLHVVEYDENPGGLND